MHVHLQCEERPLEGYLCHSYIRHSSYHVHYGQAVQHIQDRKIMIITLNPKMCNIHLPDFLHVFAAETKSLI